MADDENEQATATVEVTTVERSKLGDNQWIAIGVMAVTYMTATAFVLLDRGTVEWWGSFMGTLVPTVTGIVIGGSALIKTASAIRGKDVSQARKVTTKTVATSNGQVQPPVPSSPQGGEQ